MFAWQFVNLRTEGFASRGHGHGHSDEKARAGVAPAKHAGSTTLPEVLPHASPEPITPTTGTWKRCPHWLEQGHLNWEGPN